MVIRSPKNSVLGAHSRTMGGHTELRGHVTKPSQMRHICHLASWWLKHKKFDLFKPWHLRHPGSREASPVEMLTRTSMEDTQDERCEFSTALLYNNLQGSADRKKKKKEIKQGIKWEKWQKWAKTLSSCWMFGTQRAVAVSISCYCSLNSHLAAVTCR